MELNFWRFKQFLSLKKSPIKSDPNVSLPNSGRVSVPDIKESVYSLKSSVEFISPQFQYEMIPVIRKLIRVNSSVSLAANSIVELANTGFIYKFRKNLPKEKEREMRNHLNTVFKRWGVGTSGLHGLINKMIYQLYIGGSISIEWVPMKDLSGVDYLAFLNAENIRVAFNRGTGRYEFFQVPVRSRLEWKKNTDPNNFSNYIKLNPLTYQYIGLFTDEEAPIGIPPFLSALDDLQAQLKMLRNIGFVSDQLGLMGFLEFLMRKPSAADGESKSKYSSRLDSLLTNSKQRIKDGLKDGIVVGFKDDHEFEFHSSTKDTAGVSEIFDINHKMVANGLFTSPHFLGGINQGSEAFITVVFTKMLSQLHNIHLSLAEILERGIFLELSLAGFPDAEVDIEFKPSTITDKLKLEQAREYQLRNLRVLYVQGIINQEQFAKEAGYDEAAEKEPIGDPDSVLNKSKSKQKEEEDKDTSDRKTRDKNKPQPKRNDQKTKPR